MTLARYAIRPVRPSDVPAVVAMVHDLAEYERAADQCYLEPDQLTEALFAEQRALYGHVGVDPLTDEPVGFALWFLNFSTWRGVHGIYLEDLYVRPVARGTGLGRDLLATLAKICLDRGYHRLDWWVLKWNPARDFYAALGATSLEDWVPYRMDADGLRQLAAHVQRAGRP